VNLNFKTEFTNKESPYCRDADRKGRQTDVSVKIKLLNFVVLCALTFCSMSIKLKLCDCTVHLN